MKTEQKCVECGEAADFTRCNRCGAEVEPFCRRCHGAKFLICTECSDIEYQARPDRTFIPLASSLDAVTYLHDAACGKVATKRPGWVRCAPIQAPDAKAAKTYFDALNASDGRDDILVKICACAKKAAQ